MSADVETVVHVTPDAAWLPRFGRAEVIRRSTPPTPMCVARLLIRRTDQVFCVTRPDTGRLDLPMRVIERDDPSGQLGITALAEQITGDGSGLVFVGAVRNVVDSPSDDYAWPTPLAHFGVWTSESHPTVEGSWVSIGNDSPLRDRHWFPLVL
ncbi:NUDIX hydrolase [Herbiconiux flava]|uniref:NUDIX hydrolase n=1 Tax=Herbiconiux flava TaxID=881268 RepID=A0A852SP72_9MICO|nr:NUDIX hydrolase [Herbiconiux flava]NYD70651.1 hypothetical protein [Herbiconiux flava]GLK17408.1 hypothetical protein GCM10017602_18900 [Herbiconiux flava]